MKKNYLLTGLVLAVSIFLLSFLLVQEQWTVPDKYKNMKNPNAGKTDSDQIGKSLYLKQCKSCHGVKGKGDGPKASMLETKITDFSSEKFKAQSDGELYYKTFVGKGEMPGFESKVETDEDKWFLINYIKAF